MWSSGVRGGTLVQHCQEPGCQEGEAPLNPGSKLGLEISFKQDLTLGVTKFEFVSAMERQCEVFLCFSFELDPLDPVLWIHCGDDGWADCVLRSDVEL